MDLSLPTPERATTPSPSVDPAPSVGVAPRTVGAPGPAPDVRDPVIHAGFGALYADPGAARTRFDTAMGLDRAGSLRILADSPQAFGALRGEPTIGAPLARVLADTPAPGGTAPQPDVRLEFDGRTLTLRRATPDRIERTSFPGVSGRPDGDGRFDNSEARQAMPRTGPLPEGVYHIHVDEVQSISTRDQLLGMVGRGAWPGGTISWGEQRVWIHPGATHTDARSVEAPVPGTDRTVTRDGFSIHGGRTPGSAGCIDLTSRAGAFFGRLSEVSHTGGTIPLYVNYPETPGGPSPR